MFDVGRRIIAGVGGDDTFGEGGGGRRMQMRREMTFLVMGEGVHEGRSLWWMCWCVCLCLCVFVSVSVCVFVPVCGVWRVACVWCEAAKTVGGGQLGHAQLCAAQALTPSLLSCWQATKLLGNLSTGAVMWALPAARRCSQLPQCRQYRKLLRPQSRPSFRKLACPAEPSEP